MFLIKSALSIRKILLPLVLNEFKLRYFGNSLGALWAFIQPLATILVMWFVFQVGFKAVPVDNFPFVLWLAAGMIPWFFIADGINNATSSILSNSYLVKKIAFNVNVLPLISILSSLIVHCFFIVFLMLMFMVYGYEPNIYWFQLPYYTFSCLFLVLSISMLTSSLVVYIKDVKHLVSVFVQFGFWLTPIFWNFKLIPEKFLHLISLNPFLHIIDGYRESLIYGQWFWEDQGEFVYFWLFSFLTYILASYVFDKLRPMFADVI